MKRFGQQVASLTGVLSCRSHCNCWPRVALMSKSVPLLSTCRERVRWCDTGSTTDFAQQKRFCQTASSSDSSATMKSTNSSGDADKGETARAAPVSVFGLLEELTDIMCEIDGAEPAVGEGEAGASASPSPSPSPPSVDKTELVHKGKTKFYHLDEFIAATPQAIDGLVLSAEKQRQRRRAEAKETESDGVVPPEGTGEENPVLLFVLSLSQAISILKIPVAERLSPNTRIVLGDAVKRTFVSLTDKEVAELFIACMKMRMGEKRSLGTMASIACAVSHSLGPSTRVELLRALGNSAKLQLLDSPPDTTKLCAGIGSITHRLQPHHMIFALEALYQLKRDTLWDTANKLSRALLPHVDELQPYQLVVILKAAVWLEGLLDALVTKTVTRLCAVSSVLTPREIGDVCRCLDMISNNKSNLAAAMSSNTRRLLPLLVKRVGQLKEQFSIRDARHIIRCLQTYRIQHGLIFSRLVRTVGGADQRRL